MNCMEDVHSFVDDILLSGNSPDSLRLDCSDTEEALNTFLMETATPSTTNPAFAISCHEVIPQSSSSTSVLVTPSVVKMDDDSVSNCSSSNSSGIDLTFDLIPSTTATSCQNQHPVTSQPSSSSSKKTAVLWKQVVVTVDDENNIIDDEDEAKSAEQDNHHHQQPTCHNTIEHPPLPVISSEQQLPPTAAPAAEAVTGFCGVCKLVFSSESQLADHRLAYAQKIACCHCLKTFATMAKLRAHHRKHSKEKPFQCRSCGKYYTHRQSLARHQLLYCHPLKEKIEDKVDKSVKSHHHTPAAGCNHVGNEPSSNQVDGGSKTETSCRVCKGEFYDPKSLSNHTEYYMTHKECCLCHKVLGNKSKLLTHHRSHTKELPYKCTMCDKRFSENSTLRKHIATHGDRNFQCSVCSKAFVRKDYLAKHELIHRQTYKCSQCRFVCHEKSQIEAHVAQSHLDCEVSHEIL